MELNPSQSLYLVFFFFFFFQAEDGIRDHCVTGVQTCALPIFGAYRGVGMTMGAFVMERLLDMVAERLGLDPAEVRRRNLIPREAYPFTSASGLTYDSGDFPKALEQVLAAVDYDRLRRDQAAARAAGRLVGLGVACYTEYTGMGAAVFRRRGDRKSTRLNSSHTVISYAVFCLKKKKNKQN